MRRLIFLALIAAFLFGCKEPEEPIPAPPAGTVPLKVWVVRAPSDPDTGPGILSNKGCRLSDDEIRDRIHHLQNNAATLYGANVEFAWMPETPTEIHDQSLDDLPSIRYRSLNHIYDIIVIDVPNQGQNQHWESGSINIYFVGDIQDLGPLTPYPTFPATGKTLDPSDLNRAGAPTILGIVILNDCGFDSASGFPNRAVTPGPIPTVLAFDPAAVTTYNIIEHEMTHYLARFYFRCFPPTNPLDCYSTTEHSNQANNILKAGISPVPPLVLPGNVNDPSTERGEIWNRVLTQRWNSVS